MAPERQEILVFFSNFDSFDIWKRLLEKALPGLRVMQPEQIDHPNDVHYALVWKPPQDFFARYPYLKMVINLGAGVDSLLGRKDLPAIPITRLSDPNMARMMSSYIVLNVLRFSRDIPYFEKAQRERRWAYLHPRNPESIRVGVLGLGELGAYAANELTRHGFFVKGWARTSKILAGVHCSDGMASLPEFLAQTDILVVMLPLTSDTRHLLDAERLALLPKGCCLINASRGEVIDQEALISALQSGAVAQTALDVFAIEPLPEDSPLWDMENVLITPHLASVAIPESAVAQIVENIRRMDKGETVLHQIDPQRGY